MTSCIRGLWSSLDYGLKKNHTVENYHIGQVQGNLFDQKFFC